MKLLKTAFKFVAFALLFMLLAINILPTTYHISITAPLIDHSPPSTEFMLSTKQWVKAINVLQSSNISLTSLENSENIGGFVAFEHARGKVDATLVSRKKNEVQFHLRFNEEHQARLQIALQPKLNQVSINVNGEVLTPIVGSLIALLTKHYLTQILQTAANEMKSELRLQQIEPYK
ncbi:hypothetical protein A7985_17940 [Pseudoalteromonas luteoviolacea]|uniref:Uncharacterized protein n=1 Tax=Pseudoalteromonas luteoviolacea TaxID=43657 RepID=A0A1C0TN20_9GAMM|nr:hypothetical protein [Pseudoalteromonas luteoviolacea]OCQ20303.1 hypothetical protein A7985_17940 [Pseudoalteromonas luteoviolacea]